MLCYLRLLESIYTYLSNWVVITLLFSLPLPLSLHRLRLEAPNSAEKTNLFLQTQRAMGEPKDTQCIWRFPQIWVNKTRVFCYDIEVLSFPPKTYRYSVFQYHVVLDKFRICTRVSAWFNVQRTSQSSFHTSVWFHFKLPGKSQGFALLWPLVHETRLGDVNGIRHHLSAWLGGCGLKVHWPRHARYVSVYVSLPFDTSMRGIHF